MNLPTKAVKGIILNDKKELLLLQRNTSKKEHSNWDLPGGLVEDGESEEEALLREIYEELKIKSEIISKGRTWKFLRNKDNKTITVQNYFCKINQGKIELSEEHINYKWIKIKDLKKYSVKDESFYESIKT